MSAVLQPLARIVPMLESSLPEVIAIEDAIYEFPWTLGNFRDSMRAGYACWEYRVDRLLVGYAVTMTGVDEVHLLNLSIAAASQRQGYGRQLLAFLVDIARAQGARKLLLEVRPSNAGGRALYAAAGFEHIGTRRGYYPAANGREDAIVLALPL